MDDELQLRGSYLHGCAACGSPRRLGIMPLDMYVQ